MGKRKVRKEKVPDWNQSYERLPTYIDEEEIRKGLQRFDEDTYEERNQRIILLSKMIGRRYYQATPAIALWYFEEAKINFIYSNHVSTMIMCQLVCEEMLKAPYRYHGKLDLVSKATLNELIEKAEKDGFIQKSDRARLHKIRKFRNTLEHTKDFSDNRMRILIAPSLFSTKFQKQATESMKLADPAHA